MQYNYITHNITKRITEKADRDGVAAMRLGRGAYLVYRRIDGQCRLAFGHPAPLAPTPDEIDELSRVFHLPANDWQSRQVVNRQMGVTFNVVETTWREAQ